MPEAPWARSTGVTAVVEKWLSSGVVKPCMSGSALIPERAPERSLFPEGLGPDVRRALERRGISELYRHQAEAVAGAMAGRHVVIATPTASGKSLCFHLPVLEALRADPGASALYLFPTKALSRDQEHGIRELVREAELGLPAVVF